MSSKRSSSSSSAGGPSSKKTSGSSSSSSSDSNKQSVDPVFPASTFDEKTCVFTYCGGWVDIDDTIRKLIKSVVIEEGVTEIAESVGVDVNGYKIGMFERCTVLTSITSPKTNTFVKIGPYALCGCTSLASLAVPDSCVNIATGALYCCSSLTSFTFPKKCTKLSTNVLDGCSSLRTLYISDDCVDIEQCALANCISLTTLAIPNACTQGHELAFHNCTTLQAFTDNSHLTIEQYCRDKWRSPRLFDFKVNLFASYNVLNRLRLTNPSLNDPLIDKTSTLWVMYDRITSDDVRRNIMEFLDYRWMGNK